MVNEEVNEGRGQPDDTMRSERKKQLYESWIADHATDLYRMAYRLTNASAHAEDLVQETFYHAWKSMGSLKDPAKARAWLFQILRFRYAHWVRSRARQPRTRPLADLAGDHPADGSWRSPLDVMINQELLGDALEALDDAFKVPFLMVSLQGLTCKETAQQLDLPLGTVLSRVHRARQALRAKLRDLKPTGRLRGGKPPPQTQVNLPDGQDRTLRLRG